MKKLNFNFILKNLGGVEFPEAKMNEILANLLISQTKGDALRLYHWGLDLHKTGELNLDEQDLQTLRAIVENTEFLTVLAKGQILEIF